MLKVAWDAKGIPSEERLAPRMLRAHWVIESCFPTKPGTLDLTAARHFIESTKLHEELVSIYGLHCPGTVTHRALFYRHHRNVVLVSLESGWGPGRVGVLYDTCKAHNVTKTMPCIYGKVSGVCKQHWHCQSCC